MGYGCRMAITYPIFYDVISFYRNIFVLSNLFSAADAARSQKSKLKFAPFCPLKFIFDIYFVYFENSSK